MINQLVEKQIINDCFTTCQIQLLVTLHILWKLSFIDLINEVLSLRIALPFSMCFPKGKQSTSRLEHQPDKLGKVDYHQLQVMQLLFPLRKIQILINFSASNILSQMNSKKLQIIPYTAITLANLTYILYMGQGTDTQWYKVFLFNFGIMAFLGIFIVIKLNLMLHQWIVVEKQQDQKGNLTKKGMLKQKISYYLKKSYLLDSIFLPGNQKVFLKIYFGLTFVRYMTSYVPGLLMTLLTFFFFQFKGYILPVVKPILARLNELFDKVCLLILYYVPKYTDIIRKIPGKQTKVQ